MRVSLIAFAMAFVTGSLVEYWGHRAMHVWLKRERHIQHHQSGMGQGLRRELLGYAFGVWPMFLIGFVHSLAAGAGFAAGALVYCGFAAYAHELQHAHPECCFWLGAPVHHIHHSGKMWHHNFGITFDVWDRVFGTYRRTDWQPTVERSWRNLFHVEWVVTTAPGPRELARRR
jgi:sterol desaturase/sphingolipid hydroxylase (fatty acid hydroxylase superfamily)